jgi:multidrug efflux pump subunit AcrA (membrane-fusion protein)
VGGLLSRRTGLYRQRALAQSDKREELDQRVAVVGPSRWFALVLAVLVIVGLLAWSAVAKVRTTVSAVGVTSVEGVERPVDTPAAGTLQSLPLLRGMSVHAGQVVARIDTATGATTEVRAAVNGRLEHVAATPGGYVAAGTQLATIVPDGAPLTAVVFVELADAEQVVPGLRVELRQAASRTQDADTLLGRVATVGTQPVTTDELRLVAGTERGERLAAAGELLRVDVRLDRDAETPTGLAWTGGGDGPARLDIGTPVTATIVLKDDSALGTVF